MPAHSGRRPLARHRPKVTRLKQLRRESLCGSLRGEMNPGFDMVIKVLRALDVQIVAEPMRRLAEPGLSKSAPANDLERPAR